MEQQTSGSVSVTVQGGRKRVMMALMFVTILLLTPLFIGQVESVIDNTETEELEEAELIPTEVEYEPYKPIEQMVKIGITAFSILLVGLSISAYRKTRLKAIVYAAVAFGLFAVQVFFDYLEDAVEGFEAPYTDIIFLGITLAILVLFFMAIVRKR
jgi:hypothetical protein